VVPGNLPDPPYPADTRVNGWRFELDVERIKRSDTWVMASPEWRPWLLMTWMVAWDQRPAGSLPADHALIAAHIGMDIRLFTAHADILLRGFVRHSDGRLYHAVVVEQVQRLISMREQERDRKAKFRQKSASVPQVSRGTDAGKTLQEQEQEQEKERRLRLSASETPRIEVPYQQIVDAYHTALPKWKAVKVLSADRKTKIRARWVSEFPTIEHWAAYFRRVAMSPFLTNRTDAVFRNDNIDFLIRPANLAQIIEGKYDQRSK
jgi:hypothetical protein